MDSCSSHSLKGKRSPYDHYTVQPAGMPHCSPSWVLYNQQACHTAHHHGYSTTSRHATLLTIMGTLQPAGMPHCSPSWVLYNQQACHTAHHHGYSTTSRHATLLTIMGTLKPHTAHHHEYSTTLQPAGVHTAHHHGYSLETYKSLTVIYKSWTTHTITLTHMLPHTCTHNAVGVVRKL